MVGRSTQNGHPRFSRVFCVLGLFLVQRLPISYLSQFGREAWDFAKGGWPVQVSRRLSEAH